MHVRISYFDADQVQWFIDIGKNIAINRFSFGCPRCVEILPEKPTAPIMFSKNIFFYWFSKMLIANLVEKHYIASWFCDFCK